MTFIYGPCRVWIGDTEFEALDVKLSVSTPSRVDFDTDVESRVDDNDTDYSGWYCVKTLPFHCPASGCDFVAEYMTAAHMIVVWPSIDDSALLACAQAAKQAGRDPRVAEYEVAFGPCIAFDEWERIGRPVHAIREYPPGWSPKERL